MKNSAQADHASTHQRDTSGTAICALCLIVAAILSICDTMAADYRTMTEIPPGSSQAFFPSPDIVPPCECPDVTDLDGDGNTTEWRRCAIINGYNEFQKGCASIDDLRPWFKLTKGSGSLHVYFPPPGFLPACQCQDVTDLDEDGSTTDMRACAVINGYNEFQKGCITIDVRPRPGLSAGSAFKRQ